MKKPLLISFLVVILIGGVFIALNRYGSKNLSEPKKIENQSDFTFQNPKNYPVNPSAEETQNGAQPFLTTTFYDDIQTIPVGDHPGGGTSPEISSSKKEFVEGKGEWPNSRILILNSGAKALFNINTYYGAWENANEPAKYLKLQADTFGNTSHLHMEFYFPTMLTVGDLGLRDEIVTSLLSGTGRNPEQQYVRDFEDIVRSIKL